MRPVMGPLSGTGCLRSGRRQYSIEDALYLANTANKVYLVISPQPGSFGANRLTVEAVKARRNIEIIYDSTVEEITGRDFVEAVEIQNRSRFNRQKLAVSGVFVAIGWNQNQQFSSMLRLDGAGYIVAGEDCKTNISGVYVAGDTRKKSTPVGNSGSRSRAVAATEAAQYCAAI